MYSTIAVIMDIKVIDVLFIRHAEIKNWLIKTWFSFPNDCNTNLDGPSEAERTDPYHPIIIKFDCMHSQS